MKVSSVSKRVESRRYRRAVPKLKKSLPHPFVIETLSHLAIETRPLFGCLAVYFENKIVLALRDKRDGSVDDGVWLATTQEHHESLCQEFPSMRSIEVLGKSVTGWQLLPVDAGDFESAALRACELIADGDPRIGKVPRPRARTKTL